VIPIDKTALLMASLVDIRPTIAITKAHMKVGVWMDWEMERLSLTFLSAS
jgi:hypothetical protein